MNHNPSVPSPSDDRQSESTASGTEWNNGITRRSFLKRTGGATLATMVTWHLATDQSLAGNVLKAELPLKAKVTIGAGEFSPVGNPEVHGPGELELSDWTTLNSGESLTDWENDDTGNHPRTRLIDGVWYYVGPATITYTREKQ